MYSTYSCLQQNVWRSAAYLKPPDDVVTATAAPYPLHVSHTTSTRSILYVNDYQQSGPERTGWSRSLWATQVMSPPT